MYLMTQEDIIIRLSDGYEFDKYWQTEGYNKPSDICQDTDQPRYK